MAWPLAVGMLSFTLMGVVDTLLMGRVGTAEQAGVGLGATLAFASMAFFRGLLTGPQSVVAAADGAGDGERALVAGGSALAMGVVSGLTAGAILWLGHEALLQWAVVGHSADSDAVAGAAGSYLAIRALGLPFTLTAFGLLGGLQGLGDTRSRMWVSLAGNAVNIGLDLLLIFGAGPVPAMGEQGAAWATVAGSATMATLYAVRYLQVLGIPRRPTWAVVRACFDVGLPSGVQWLLDVAAFTVINLLLARAGAQQLAASEIVLNIVSVSFLPGHGVGEAGGILVGRYFGARRTGSAIRALRSARFIAVVLMAGFALVFLAGGEALGGLFTTDPEVAALAGRLLLYAAAFQVFDALAMVNLNALRGVGDTRFSLLLTTTGAWLVTLPTTIGMGLLLGWGAEGMWLGLTLEIALLALFSGWRLTGLRTGAVGRREVLLGTQ